VVDGSPPRLEFLPGAFSNSLMTLSLRLIVYFWPIASIS
jgi:hypothetical protein